MILLLAATLAGCELVGRDCSLAIVAGIHVDWVDATTSAPIVSEELEVVARDGSYADTVRGRSNPHGLADERAGVYDVEVRAAGYLPWDTSGVVVTEGRCHVQTVEITAELTPEI